MIGERWRGIGGCGGDCGCDDQRNWKGEGEQMERSGFGYSFQMQQTQRDLPHHEEYTTVYNAQG